jgi:hypothetical protein
MYSPPLLSYALIASFLTKEERQAGGGLLVKVLWEELVKHDIEVNEIREGVHSK